MKSMEYEYIGPKEILDKIQEKYKGKIIRTSQDIIRWISDNNEKLRRTNKVVCTFVINLEGEFLIADRHSEHVQCAMGENVMSGGEIEFQINLDRTVSINSITNQSTGYCPAPESWIHVEEALNKTFNLTDFEGFSTKFTFSYCPSCRMTQIVKDDFYYCTSCYNDLLDGDEFQAKRKELVP